MNRKPSEDMPRLASAIEAADDGFWSVINVAYPEAEHGDFPPDAAFAFAEAQREAAVIWLKANADEQPEVKYCKVLLHDIEYAYIDGSEINVTDMEEIAYKISQGIGSDEFTKTISVTTEKCDIQITGSWSIA